MYCRHWGIESSPFTATPGADQAYPSEPLTEANARIEYLIAARRRMGVLLGDSGVGKTTTLAAAARSLATRGASVAVIDAVAITPRELLSQLAEQLFAGPDPADDLAKLWRRVEDALAQHRWRNKAAVLLVDDAQRAGVDVQRTLVRLAHLEATPDARWTIVLSCETSRLVALDESLLHLIDLRIDLPPWTADDTTGYIQHNLVEAGCYTPAFSDSALDRLHALTEGVARRVARLADFALVVGASQQTDQIAPETVDDAFEEIAWRPLAQAASQELSAEIHP